MLCSLKRLGEESDTEDEEKTMAKKEVQVSAEEKKKEINLGMDPQKLRPISISSKLSKEERSKLISLLKEFKDIFTWEYNEIPRLDLGLVVHMLNVEHGAKPIAQLARVFHINVEEKIVKEVKSYWWRDL